MFNHDFDVRRDRSSQMKFALRFKIILTLIGLMVHATIFGAQQYRSVSNAKPVTVTSWPNEGTQDQPLSLLNRLELLNSAALERAFLDMGKTWPDRINIEKSLNLLSAFVKRRENLVQDIKSKKQGAEEEAEKWIGQIRNILLANPLLDFGRLICIKRNVAGNRLGLPQNWESNSSIPRNGIDNSIVLMTDLRSKADCAVLYKPKGNRFVGDLNLHFDAQKLMYSSIGDDGRWGIFELQISEQISRQLPMIPDRDVDNYTSCYLPDDSILFTSTAPFIGVPCVRGSSHVAHIYRYWPQTGKIRRLTFDQEHNWCPTLMPDGRVLYLRWEYSDLPHYVARILFTMNPDGTNQREFYGSGSYWPNAFFYAKPMPGSIQKVVGIVGGHHGVPRMGEMVIIDPALGRFEAEGVIQRIPGYNQPVDPVIQDNLVDESWPKFLHPIPLSEKYILVSCKPSRTSLWGIYLVDIFDNMTLIYEEPGYAMLEPIPLHKTVRPPVIPDAIREGEKNAFMQVIDIYQGPGLQGVPRGTIKKIRLFTYNFSYHGMGGQWDRVGIDGPWDIKRIIGTVPVEPDGSAFFEVPANQPISLQPLDEQGRAVALMRSWTTAMPGEVQSCVGCHEKQNSTSVLANNQQALRRTPSKIEPFYGPMRGFSFDREVQPVLDRYCIACHNGTSAPEKKDLPNFCRGPYIFAGEKEVKFPPAYVALKAFVRNPTAENDMHMLTPGEFHASTTELVQLLESGHYGVKLDAESWDRLNTWIDLNTPAHGTWVEMVGQPRMGKQRERRRELTLRYAGIDDDTDAVYASPAWKPEPLPMQTNKIAKSSQTLESAITSTTSDLKNSVQTNTLSSVDLGNGITMKLNRLPAGRFVSIGKDTPGHVLTIDKSFWIGTYEVNNEQYACYDPQHDSRIEHGDFLQFSIPARGKPLNEPKQPVSHVSWNEVQSFCQWLSARIGKVVKLPTGMQWEYACRAGSTSPLSFGNIDTDFSKWANLADINLRNPKGYRSPTVPEWRPAIVSVNDGNFVSAPVGSYQPNAWGLYDMHGNVWEWTEDCTNDGNSRLVRGGSWYVRPKRATAETSLAYKPWQKVYDVGFRVVVEDP